ncbi:MAG: invasion associated locus B family protein [Rhizobiaceae bacterium]
MALIQTLAAATIGMAGLAITPASAQDAAAAAAPAAPRGWFKVCAKQEDNDICNTQNIVTADSGQLLTAVSLIEVKGKVTKKILQISVPTGRLIPAGIGMQIGQNKPVKVEYGICFPDRCIAEAALSNELIAGLKKGADLTLTSVNFQNKPNPLKISLSGFGAAYDGPGLKQSELEEQNKKLQDEMAKRKDEFEKKLKAEQDKAKAGSGG